VFSPESLLHVLDAVETAGQELLDRHCQRALELVEGRVPVETALCRGPVVDALLGLSADAERIVVQRRSPARLRRLLTGSTVAGLAARAPVPVVVVPERWAGPRATPPVYVWLGEGVDALGAGAAVLDRAFREAENRGAPLSVLHASNAPARTGGSPERRRAREDRRQAARARLVEQVASRRAAHPMVEVRVEGSHLHPAEALVQVSGHSRLLVVGRRGHGLVRLGPVARRLVREAHCPLVLVTRVDQPSRRAAPWAVTAR
jgi:nucleotide-binding universal stress UspA family protein